MDPDSQSAAALVIGLSYRDIIMTGLSALPNEGEEVYAEAIHETWGGVATMARVLSRLGVETHLSTSVGTDPTSHAFLTDMASAGIDTALSDVHDGWPFPTTVAISTGSDRAMITRELQPPNTPGTSISEIPGSVRTVIADLRDAPRPCVARARARGARVYSSRGFDPSGQWGREQLPGLSQCDAWVLNDLEATAFTGHEDPLEAARELSNRVATVVVTRGKHGMVGIDRRTGEEATVAAFESRALNKTGAGDSTLAAFAFADRPGISLETRLLTAAFIVSAILDSEEGAAAPLTLAEYAKTCALLRDSANSPTESRRAGRVIEVLEAAR